MNRSDLFKCAVCNNVQHASCRSIEATDEPICEGCVDKLIAAHRQEFTQDFVQVQS